jgi:hypothetical protein
MSHSQFWSMNAFATIEVTKHNCILGVSLACGLARMIKSLLKLFTSNLPSMVYVHQTSPILEPVLTRLDTFLELQTYTMEVGDPVLEIMGSWPIVGGMLCVLSSFCRIS